MNIGLRIAARNIPFAGNVGEALPLKLPV